jgi:HK97 family phage major capsid protein
MLDINDLRRKRAEVSEKVDAIAALEKEGAELSKEQEDQFYALSDEFDGLTSKIDRQERAEKSAAVAAKPVVVASVASTNVVNLPEHKGAKVARMVQAIGSVTGGAREAAHYAETTLGDPDVAMALNTGTDAKGGFIVPKAFSGDMIELLTPMSVVRSSGAIALPMPNGNLNIPKLTGGALSNYMGEGEDIVGSEQTMGNLSLAAKKLATLVPLSNELLNYNGLNGNIERMIIGDMTNSIALREDLAFMRGDGSSNTPTGLRNLALTDNVIAASDGSTVQKIESDLGKLKLALMNSSVRMIQPGWLLNPTVQVFLSKLVTETGVKVYPEMAQGMLDGYPYKTTTQLPFNLGAGTNESEIALVDFADAVIGEGENITIAISTEATYKDPNSGDMVSAFSRDQTLLRVITANDFGLRHDASNAWLTGITWGQ